MEPKPIYLITQNDGSATLEDPPVPNTRPDPAHAIYPYHEILIAANNGQSVVDAAALEIAQRVEKLERQLARVEATLTQQTTKITELQYLWSEEIMTKLNAGQKTRQATSPADAAGETTVKAFVHSPEYPEDNKV